MSTTAPTPAPHAGARNLPDPKIVGSPVEIQTGREYFQSAQFNGFELPIVKVVGYVQEGETHGAAVLRLHAELAETLDEIFAQRAQSHLKRLEHVFSATKGIGR